MSNAGVLKPLLNTSCRSVSIDIKIRFGRSASSETLTSKLPILEFLSSACQFGHKLVETIITTTGIIRLLLGERVSLPASRFIKLNSTIVPSSHAINGINCPHNHPCSSRNSPMRSIRSGIINLKTRVSSRETVAERVSAKARRHLTSSRRVSNVAGRKSNAAKINPVQP